MRRNDSELTLKDFGASFEAASEFISFEAASSATEKVDDEFSEIFFAGRVLLPTLFAGFRVSLAGTGNLGGYPLDRDSRDFVSR
ncbi:MAG: hypothetical protein ACKOFJ_01410 [Actinomycetota bacterium]